MEEAKDFFAQRFLGTEYKCHIDFLLAWTYAVFAGLPQRQREALWITFSGD
jgi:hypothetical protein